MNDKIAKPEAKGATAPKRAKKAVESTFAEKWEPRQGDTLEGRYLGFEKARGKRDEDFNAYQIQDASGKRWSVSGAHLNSLLPQVPLSTYIWLTYTADREMQNGDMKMFSLEIEEGVELIPTLKDK